MGYVGAAYLQAMERRPNTCWGPLSGKNPNTVDWFGKNRDKQSHKKLLEQQTAAAEKMAALRDGAARDVNISAALRPMVREGEASPQTQVLPIEDLEAPVPEPVPEPSPPPMQDLVPVQNQHEQMLVIPCAHHGWRPPFMGSSPSPYAFMMPRKDHTWKLGGGLPEEEELTPRSKAQKALQTLAAGPRGREAETVPGGLLQKTRILAASYVAEDIPERSRRRARAGSGGLCDSSPVQRLH